MNENVTQRCQNEHARSEEGSAKGARRQTKDNSQRIHGKSQLHGKGLISNTARNNSDAGQMVTDIQNRLDGDEAVWDNLLGVLDKTPLREDLVRALSEKTGTNQGRSSTKQERSSTKQERSSTGGRTARKFKTRQKY